MPPDAQLATPQPAEGGLVVGHWPHLRGKESISRVMWSVAAALVPAAVASGYFFGIRAYLHIGLATATAVVVEAVITRLRLGKATLGDGSAVVTGLLVAFCLPAQARWFVPIVASVVAIGIAKQCFGGLGCNIWNPALVGRAFVHVSFPVDMNPAAYPVLEAGHFLSSVGTAVTGVPAGVEAITSASPMAHLKAVATGHQAAAGLAGKLPGLWDMFLGNVGGSIGETSVLLLLAGAVYLIARGWIRWQIPVTYVAMVAVGALLLPLDAGEKGWMPIVFHAGAATLAPHFVAYHLLGGGLALGAFYMATDMVTSPLTNRGMLVFGFGCGLLTILIRLYGGYPEAVCYSILLMNTAVPLIDRWTQPRLFGHTQ
ncbi:MAG TPA: RnfABCDGE type electron transport complex subunit D [Phycisphaerae bacterium]|nr:RnfABCDGE type electron transport complex subunit D [Phycisphaerae bacterium]